MIQVIQFYGRRYLHLSPLTELWMDREGCHGAFLSKYLTVYSYTFVTCTIPTWLRAYSIFTCKDDMADPKIRNRQRSVHHPPRLMNDSMPTNHQHSRPKQSDTGPHQRSMHASYAGRTQLALFPLIISLPNPRSNPLSLPLSTSTLGLPSPLLPFESVPLSSALSKKKKTGTSTTNTSRGSASSSIVPGGRGSGVAGGGRISLFPRLISFLLWLFCPQSPPNL